MSTQRPLDFNAPSTEAYARSTDPQTSRDAADSLKMTELETSVYTALARTDGATCSELGAMMQLPRDSISPRMPPLLRKGHIVDSGLRRPGPSRRQQIVWKAVRHG
jgi:hypothetical protein